MICVTHIFKTYFPNTQGGLEEAIRQMGKYTLKHGYSVKVVSVSRHPFAGSLDGIQCKSFHHTFGSNSIPFSLSLLKNFKKIVKETDILHLQFPWPTGELLTLLFHVHKPMVITFHCDIHKHQLFRFLYTPFIRLLFKKARVIVPTSENLMNSSAILKEFKSKCHPINLWLDEDRFLRLPDAGADFKSRVSTFGEFCLFVGVLRWYKGLDIVLDASKYIKRNIVIVGKGPLYNRLKKRIENEQLTNIFLMGYQPDENVNYLLKKCLFIILPSISPAEAFGQILLEGSYFKKPMVTTELGTGTSYVNLDEVTGFIVEPNNAVKFADRCNILFENNALRSNYGNMAYDRYKNTFTADIQGPKYIEIYKNIVQ